MRPANARLRHLITNPGSPVKGGHRLPWRMCRLTMLGVAGRMTCQRPAATKPVNQPVHGLALPSGLTTGGSQIGVTDAAGWCDYTWGNCGWHEPAATHWSGHNCSIIQRDEGRQATSAHAATGQFDARNSNTKVVIVAPGTGFKAFAHAWGPAVRLVPAASVPKQLQGAVAAGRSSSRTVTSEAGSKCQAGCAYGLQHQGRRNPAYPS